MYVGVPSAPPPPPRGARGLTARPADPLGLGQRSPPPPPLQPLKRLNTPRGSNPGREQPPWFHLPVLYFNAMEVRWVPIW